MKFVLLIGAALCLIGANAQAVVKVNPDGKTYTVDQYGRKLDKKPDQKQNKDVQKVLPKPTIPKTKKK